MQRRAIALLSGGLDSILAVRLILDQGIPVTALRFITHFGCDPVSEGSCGHDVEPLVKLWGGDGLTVKMAHLGQDYIDMVRNPAHGRGRNMNPCVDCRIMMLGWAREFLIRSGQELLDAHGGGFLVTGEVLNQRPMSQTLARFHEIDRELGLVRRVLRPLSAKLLPVTVMEEQGMIDRSRLLDIGGRGRTRQYELAAKYGLENVPQPSGGCLLTDPGYSARLRDLWDRQPDSDVRDLNFLRVGRHFRVDACKIIVGRDEDENRMIETFAGSEDPILKVRDHQGPSTVIRGPHGEETLRRAAAITARYSDAPDKSVEVAVAVSWRRGESRELSVIPAEDSSLRPLRVGVTS